MSLLDKHLIEDHGCHHCSDFGRRGWLGDRLIVGHRALLLREVRVVEEPGGLDLDVDGVHHQLAGELAVVQEAQVDARGAAREQEVQVPGAPVVDLGLDGGVDQLEADRLDPVADGQRADRGEAGLLPDVGPESVAEVSEVGNVLIH